MTLQQLQYAASIADTGSINSAAKELFISQSRLSGAIRELEEEMGVSIFLRTNRGVVPTAEGEEFLGYARQILDQCRLMKDKYLSGGTRKHKFSVSTQHYTFAVQAFIRTIRSYSGDDFAFAVHETSTERVIRDVSTLKSEVGVLYLNGFNRDVLGRLFYDSEVEFTALFDCPISVYLWSGHPLAERARVTLEELAPYPCLSFEQGGGNSFYFAEEVMSTYPYRQIIKADDRATMLNLMVGLNGYTLCCGIICEELNGDAYRAVPLDTDERMTIGYIKKRQAPLSPIAREYVAEIQKYGGKGEK